MSKSLRIAGVSVDAENLPTKEELINQAMITKAFRDNPLAKEEINKAIKESGLYPRATEKPKSAVIGGESTKTD